MKTRADTPSKLAQEADVEIAHNQRIIDLVIALNIPSYVLMTARHMHSKEYIHDLTKRLRAAEDSIRANMLDGNYKNAKFMIKKYLTAPQPSGTSSNYYEMTDSFHRP